MDIARILLPLLLFFVVLTPSEEASAAACEGTCGTDTYRIIERHDNRTEVIIRNGSGASISEVCSAGTENGRWMAGGRPLSASECVTRTLVRECERWKLRGYGWPTANTNCGTQDSIQTMYQQARAMGAHAHELYIRVPMFPQHVLNIAAPVTVVPPIHVPRTEPTPPVPPPIPEPPKSTPEMPSLSALTSLETTAARIAENVADIHTTLRVWDRLPKDEETPFERIVAYATLALLLVLIIALLVLLPRLIRALWSLQNVGDDVSTIKNICLDEVHRDQPRR